MPFYAENEIRLYLLGALDDERREQLEDSLLTSDEGLNQIEIAEEELLDDFLTGELDTAERTQFEQHFLRTTVRKQKLEYLRAIRVVAAQSASVAQPKTDNVVPFQAQPQRRPFFREMNRSVYLKLAAAILLTCTAGFLFWRFALRPAQSEALVALNRAYATGRPFEPRIGGFDYAPYAPTRGANNPETEARILRERAQRILLDNIAEKNSASNQYALGKYYLAERQFDKAIEQFNAALKDLPSYAELHNDLGVALFEKAKYEKRNNQPGDSLQHLAAAFESISQSLKLQPNYPAAIFNKALCLQEMYLPRQAIEEWKKYLQLDPNSPWTTEARRRLEELEKAPSNVTVNDDELYKQFLASYSVGDVEPAYDLFCQGYSTTGNAITERLIDEVLTAKQNKDETAAANKLQLLQKLGALIYQRTNDPYVRDVARYYQILTPAQVPKLIQARRYLNFGRQLRSSKQSEAEKQYQSALFFFQQVQDKCEEMMTACLLGRLHLRQKNLSKSQALFANLVSPTNLYLWLRGESLNGMAEFYATQLLSEEAIQANQAALSIAQQIGNTSQIVINAGTLALRFSDLGNWEQALNYQTRALILVTLKTTNHHQHWFTYAETAHQLYLAKFYASALIYQQEALNIELTVKRQLQLSRTYSYLAMMLGQEARFAEALPIAQEAVDIGRRQATEKAGIEIQAHSGLYLAGLQYKAGSFFAALQNYEHLLKLNQQLQDSEDNFEIYRGKALTEMAIGNTNQAKRDLTKALEILEQSRDQISTETERTTFLGATYEAYDIAIGLAYSENPQAAFELSEKSRARSLLETMKGSGYDKWKNDKNIRRAVGSTSPLTVQVIQRQLPAQMGLLEISCLPDRLLMFGVSSSGFTHKQSIISLPLLEQKVQAFIQAISSPPGKDTVQTQVLAAELYQILIEPLEPFFAKSQIICIVPDKVLHRLPFAALYSMRQQKYLVESYGLIFAPSASIFLLCSERTRLSHSSHKERALVIGNPHFDSTSYPMLTDLAATTFEARKVASQYNRARLLTDDQASESNVKAEIEDSTIIHFATHGIVDERSWANSRLLLTKPTISSHSEDGALRVYEIMQLQLQNTKLVVLSACQSGIGRYYQGEGAMGMNRAFLAAGATSVVASYWVINSEVSAQLMADFHQQLTTRSVSQALRHAQLNLINSVDQQYRHPYFWAGFNAYGADVIL